MLLCTCEHLCVQASVVTCSWGMCFICPVVGVSAHLFLICLFTRSPRGLGSLLWAPACLCVQAAMCVCSRGWYVEVVELELP